jgi:Rad3-related DNA helicase
MRKEKISVRNLVEFILKKGSIDVGKNSEHTALEGARIHRKLQKAAGADYQAEVTLKYVTKVGQRDFQVEGRADGIFKEGPLTVVDEIKTSETPFELLDAATLDLFFYQAMVYAYIYGVQNKVSEMIVQVTYYQTTEKTISKTRRQFTLAELTTFFNQLLKDYEKWLLFKEKWRVIRNTSLKELTFPYGEFRPGQRELASVVYKTIINHKQLLTEAPTGTGKTISTIFPALKALGEGLGDRLFYLTAKTITRQVAEDALKAVSEKSARTKAVTLTAKDKICFLEKRNCTPEHCPFANGYYDRINEALWDLLNHEDLFTRPVLETYARKHTVCPFELSLDVSLWCDVVVGDYNYLFDPTVYLRRFFDEDNEDYIFLIDEAHNLVNRSKEMYSAELTKSSGEQVAQKVPKTFKKFHRRLNKITKEFQQIEQTAKESGWTYHHQQATSDTLLQLLYSWSECCQEWLAENPQNEWQELVLTYFFAVQRFTKMSERYDDHYETLIEIKNGDVTVKLFCIDPADFLQESFSKGIASVIFSATLSPSDYYKRVLTGSKTSLSFQIASPFEKAKQLVAIDATIQTTYRQRAQNIDRIVGAIKEVTASQTGNYFVFFPSFQFLDDVAARFLALYPNEHVVVQGTHLTEEERVLFLKQFVEHPTTTVLGFCVLGGVFSEGIDLAGTRLIGSIIVGVGLPQMNHEQELIKDYFNNQGQNGFSYAYQLPGMNKVLQAAGRVIRGAHDKGIIYLIDERFLQGRYEQLLPQHWRPYQVVRSAASIQKLADDFWQE